MLCGKTLLLLHSFCFPLFLNRCASKTTQENSLEEEYNGDLDTKTKELADSIIVETKIQAGLSGFIMCSYSSVKNGM